MKYSLAVCALVGLISRQDVIKAMETDDYEYFPDPEYNFADISEMNDYGEEFPDYLLEGEHMLPELEDDEYLYNEEIAESAPIEDDLLEVDNYNEEDDDEVNLGLEADELMESDEEAESDEEQSESGSSSDDKESVHEESGESGSDDEEQNEEKAENEPIIMRKVQ